MLEQYEAIKQLSGFGPLGASTVTLIVLGALTLTSLAMDYLASMYSAKKLGATWRGVLGAVVGGMIGTLLFFNLVPVLYSFYGHREPNERAGDMAH